MLHSISKGMKISLIKIGYAVVLLGGAAYGFVELRGPNGIAAVVQKRQEIRALEQENEKLHREIEAKKARIERLTNNPDEQEMEIRKELKLMKPGEKSYIMQDQPSR
jgi:cell division protein FtsB